VRFDFYEEPLVNKLELFQFAKEWKLEFGSNPVLKKGQNCSSGSVSSFENQTGSGLVLM
jgi:hypothetical protein